MKIVVITLVLLAVALVVFLLFRKRNKPSPEPVHHNPYSAVRIKPHQHACDAAFDLSHRVYLVSEAPLLPLPNCNKTESCRCGYVHYDDRRHGLQRRGKSIVMRDVYSKKERREDEHFGRRKDDDL